MGDCSVIPQPPRPWMGCISWLLIADGLDMQKVKGSSDVTARSALSQRMHVLGQTLKGIHPNDLDVDGPLSNKKTDIGNPF
jgi:hypothetical protein